jgi:hypothetical protein
MNIWEIKSTECLFSLFDKERHEELGDEERVQVAVVSVERERESLNTK